MKFLHSMVRIRSVEKSLDFYCKGLGLKELRRKEVEKGRFTLIFLGVADHQGDGGGEIELTYNWDDTEAYSQGRNFGHLAFAVDDIYATCEHLESLGIEISRPPRDGHMAFVKSPDAISVELLQKGDSLATHPDWSKRENKGTW